jgi:hypothetical protein
MSPLLPNLGLEVPAEFPVDSYESVVSAMNPLNQIALWREWVVAWNAVGHRFLAADHYAKSFRNAALAEGLGATHQARYEEERAVFGFFANAVSSLDAAHYALYAIGSFLMPLYFYLILIERQHGVNADSTYHAFARGFPNDPVASQLKALRKKMQYKVLRKNRNILVHRAAFPRHHGLQQGTLWIPGVPFEPEMLMPLQAGLARLLTHVCETAAFFVSHRIQGVTA